MKIAAASLLFCASASAFAPAGPAAFKSALKLSSNDYLSNLRAEANGQADLKATVDGPVSPLSAAEVLFSCRSPSIVVATRHR